MNEYDRLLWINKEYRATPAIRAFTKELLTIFTNPFIMTNRATRNFYWRVSITLPALEVIAEFPIHNFHFLAVTFSTCQGVFAFMYNGGMYRCWWGSDYWNRWHNLADSGVLKTELCDIIKSYWFM